MHKRRSTLLLLSAILILACSCPTVAVPAAATLEAAAPGVASPTLSPSIKVPTATVAAAAPTTCTPQLSANSAVNVRAGPSTLYDAIGGMNAGQVAAIDGKNSEGTWWYIVYPSAPGGHGWVAASVATATCVPASLAIIVPPPLPPTQVVVVVTSVSVSVDPTEIHVAGCMGPIQPSTANATIQVNGPIKIKWHFDTDQNGTLASHTLNFNEAGSKDVSESFMPPVTAGTYKVRLVIEGMNLGGMDFQAKYKIIC